MRLAIVGAGISGLVSAYLLSRDHDVTVFETNDYTGGHTNTVEVTDGDRTIAVDTGFIVFNELNYPRFCQLLRQLEVPWQDSNMSFSVRCDELDLEYRGSSLNTLFAQRRNLFRPVFHRLVRDIFRFFREAPELLTSSDDELTLGEYLDRNGYSRAFVDWHIVPMCAALWSAPAQRVRDFPARYVVRFFDHHRLLTVSGRPVWKTVRGGAKRYVDALTKGFRNRIRLRTPVRAIRRQAGGVRVTPLAGDPESYDEVVIGAHADQALGMLEDPTDAEREVLGAFPFEENEAVLHTDTSVMPKTRRAWASWNYRVPGQPGHPVSVTYHMNRLQALDASADYCVSLNPGPSLDPERVIARYTYHHPTYDRGAPAAQGRHAELVRRNRTSFCGAYWGYGFHEDGVTSALAVAAAYGVTL